MRFIFISIMLTLAHSTSWAFPELTRHNYNNCMVCHVSPTGGGILAEYGRSLSKELVSTWGREGEERFMWRVPSSETVLWGGDFRWMQTEVKPATGPKRKRWIHMQKDLEVAVTVGKWVGDVTVGENTLADGSDGSRMISRRHFLMYKMSDETTIRGGRFYPSFGLHIPDHTSVIRRGLGWDQDRETYNLEYAYQGEKWHFFGTGIFGRPDDDSPDREKGLSLTTAYHTEKSSKLGFSYYYGESPDVINHYMGPFAVIPFGEHFYIMGQLTAIRSHPYTEEKHQWGIVDYLRFNWEAYKGIHLFLAQQFAQTDLNEHTSRSDIHSLGLQWFPRPHFEIQVEAIQYHAQGIQKKPANGMNLLLHFYP